MKQLTVQAGDVLDFDSVTIVSDNVFRAVLTQDSALFLDGLLRTMLYNRMPNWCGVLTTDGTTYNVTLQAIERNIEARSLTLVLCRNGA